MLFSLRFARTLLIHKIIAAHGYNFIQKQHQLPYMPVVDDGFCSLYFHHMCNAWFFETLNAWTEDYMLCCAVRLTTSLVCIECRNVQSFRTFHWVQCPATMTYKPTFSRYASSKTGFSTSIFCFSLFLSILKNFKTNCFVHNHYHFRYGLLACNTITFFWHASNVRLFILKWTVLFCCLWRSCKLSHTACIWIFHERGKKLIMIS